MLSQNCKDYSQENTMYNKDADKAGTARMFLSKMIENETTNVYSLEVSMYGYKPDRKSDKIIAYTEENCECWLFSLTFDGVDNSSTVTFFPLADILQGRSICRALWDYYKISGHIEGCEILSEEVGCKKIVAGTTKNICSRCCSCCRSHFVPRSCWDWAAYCNISL